MAGGNYSQLGRPGGRSSVRVSWMVPVFSWCAIAGRRQNRPRPSWRPRSQSKRVTCVQTSLGGGCSKWAVSLPHSVLPCVVCVACAKQHRRHQCVNAIQNVTETTTALEPCAICRHVYTPAARWGQRRSTKSTKGLYDNTAGVLQNSVRAGPTSNSLGVKPTTSLDDTARACQSSFPFTAHCGGMVCPHRSG